MTADAVEVAEERPLTEDEPGDEKSRGVRVAGWVATVAAIAPILVAGIRGALRGWFPVGDDAYSAVRAWDVFSTDPPLLATWSSASMYTGMGDINHPGPLQFDLLAIPVRLLGHGAGTAVGMALTNALAVAALAWLVHRRLGSPGTAVAMGFAALLCWSMGSEMLYEPWSQFAPLLPFAAFLVAVWCAASGDLVALPVMVAAGSYSFQTHLSYAVLVPGLAAFAVGAVVLHTLQARIPTRTTLRWLGITAATTLVLWLQPLVEQLAGGREGNIAGLVRSSRADLPTPTMSMSVRACGGTLAVPPFWLPPSYGSPSFDFDDPGYPLWATTAGLTLLVGLLLVFGFRALRRGSSVVAAGAATALVAVGLGFVSTIRMPIYFGAITPTYARFMWPLGMVVWLALTFAVLDEVRAARGWRLDRLAVAAAGLAVVAGVAALPTVDHGAVAPPWTIDALDALDDDVMAAAEDAGSVLVILEDAETNLHMGPTVFALLQKADVPFYVDNSALVRQLGDSRRYAPGKAQAKLIVRSGDVAPLVPEGAEAVAKWDGPEETRVTVYLAPM